MSLGRPIPESSVTEAEREALERWTRRPTTAQALAQRARLILACAEGKTNSVVALELGVTKQMADKWRDPEQLGAATMLSPRSLDGANTQTIAVELPYGIDEHCAQARRAGARILQEPQDQFHGARTYKCLNLEGHLWTFSQELTLGL